MSNTQLTLDIKAKDPFEIYASTKVVLENAKHVTINPDNIDAVAQKIKKYFDANEQFPDQGHDMLGDFTDDVQLMFFEISAGYCFWALPDQPKWGIELSDGTREDGWYGVCKSFKRAYDEGMPVLDVDFYINATDDELKHIFRSATGADIPLLDERIFVLRENAQILKDKFDGQALNLIESCNHDAVTFVKSLVDHFPLFNDVAMYNRQEVVFLKLAHLFALDLNIRFDEPYLQNIDQLAVFADYKLPQLLRMFGILSYDKHLANLVDTYQEIPQGSVEEVEMRAGAIWGIELLRQKINHPTAMDIGHVIWLMSQDQDLQKQIKPYHRTYTIYY